MEPSALKQWHPTKNGNLKLGEFSPSSRKKVWWICGYGHESYGTVLSQKSSCIYCSGQKVLAGFNDLQTLNPEIANQWHPTKNGELKPDQITHKSGKKIWWQCALGHEFHSYLTNRLTISHCPICYGREALAGFNDLKTVNPEIAEQWHPQKNGELKPSMVTPGSKKKVWWLCEKRHEWKTGIQARKKSHCPYCGNKKVLIGYNNVSYTHPEINKIWNHEKNAPLAIDDYTAGSHKKVWWLGACGHEWNRFIYSQARLKQCPTCINYVSQPEKSILNYLIENNIPTQSQNRSLLPSKEIDIYLPQQEIAIEFNGLYWHSEEKGKNQTYHYDKWVACQKAGIKLIYIWEHDCIINSDEILNQLLLIVEKEFLPLTEDTIICSKGSIQEALIDLTKYKPTQHHPPALLPNPQNYRVWDAGKTIYIRTST